MPRARNTIISIDDTPISIALHAVFDERSSAALITTLGQATNIDANGFKINGIRPPPLLLLS
ncbi:MAG: hypothetical protein ACI9OI_002030, partial [Chitinophagales bacterium]